MGLAGVGSAPVATPRGSKAAAGYVSQGRAVLAAPVTETVASVDLLYLVVCAQ